MALTIRNYGNILTKYGSSGTTYAGLVEVLQLAYTTHKNGIVKLFIQKGFVESKQVFNFNEASDASTNKKFLFLRPEIDLEGDGVEFLNDIVRPVFKYKIVMGFKISPEKQTFDYEVAQDIIDTVIAYLSNPTNYIGFCIKLKIKTISIDEVDEHLEAVTDIEVLDNITLTSS